jgi:hypothetical protein
LGSATLILVFEESARVLLLVLMFATKSKGMPMIDEPCVSHHLS